ncbi:hypothetical protein GUJ93_ZPchr0010g7851 [Zizania palustris]|uniref:Iron hydrogenase large subunit C-terminal domain-containing protein n=1 Tax=Zizania palustris TaxID=103762 RepID=A0A8J5WGT6_ZIZPA|nr:hypothetical protein GUJ93_ZPchr0010g7851 [Zizania palustris]
MLLSSRSWCEAPSRPPPPPLYTSSLGLRTRSGGNGRGHKEPYGKQQGGVVLDGEVVEDEQVEGKPVLKFALCYGSKNMWNIVRKIKMGKCEYHFIEVMACPSGCLVGEDK